MDLEQDILKFKNDIKNNPGDFGKKCGKILRILFNINKTNNISEEIKNIIRKDLYENFVKAYPNEMKNFK